MCRSVERHPDTQRLARLEVFEDMISCDGCTHTSVIASLPSLVLLIAALTFSGGKEELQSFISCERFSHHHVLSLNVRSLSFRV